MRTWLNVLEHNWKLNYENLWLQRWVFNGSFDALNSPHLFLAVFCATKDFHAFLKYCGLNSK